MFCTKCGKELEDDAVFCTGCGAKIVKVEGGSPAVSGQEAPKKVEKTETGQTEKKQPASKKTIGIAAGAILLVLLFVLFIKGNKKINLNDYATITISGYDTVATATMTFDYDKFDEDYGDKIKIKGDGENNELAEALFGSMSGRMLLELYVGGSLDKTEGISNGDKVTYTWKCDDDAFKKATGYKLKYSDITEKVKDLEEIATFDAFADLSVTFSGVSPNGSVQLENKNTKYSYIAFTPDKMSGLSNGDVITVSISDNQNYYIDEYDAVPQEYTKEYTVEGLGAYIKETSEIPSDMMEKMKKEGEDYILSAAAKWAEESHLDGYQYIGNYFLTAKEGASVSWQNQLILMYKVQLSINSDEKDIHDANSYYTFISYNDLMQLPDGTCSVELANYGTPSDRVSWEYPGGWLGYTYSEYGYADLDTAFHKCVTQYVDRYSYEDNVEDNESAQPVADAGEDSEENTESAE